MIPDEAVEAAAKEIDAPSEPAAQEIARRALEAAAPHMLAEVERELSDAKRMIALLVLDAGGKVTLSHSAIAEVSDGTVIETMQDVVNGGWVIRARVPNNEGDSA